MFIIDFRNKLVSDYRFSVIGNSNVDKVDLVSHFTQYANYSIYLKVMSDDERYVDKIAIASENISVDEDVLVCRWTMGAVSTQCKKLYLQLQFEQGDTIIAQSRIVSVVLGDTINVDELIPVIYPQVLKELQDQIDTLKVKSFALASMSYFNDVLYLSFENAMHEIVSSVQVAIPTSDKMLFIEGANAKTLAELFTLTQGKVFMTNDMEIVKVAQSGSSYDVNIWDSNAYGYKTNQSGSKILGDVEYNYTSYVIQRTNTDIVYGNDHSGNQTYFSVDYGSNFGGKVVRRDSNDQIYVPLTPTQNGHAVSKKYVDDEIKTAKSEHYVVVDTTTYPTLADFLASTGADGNLYLYPIDTSDLTKGYYRYVWEDNAWLSLGTTEIDLTNYYDKDHDVIPNSNNAKDLGSSSYTWKDLYLGGTLTNGTQSFTIEYAYNILNNVVDSTSGILSFEKEVMESISADKTYLFPAVSMGTNPECKATITNSGNSTITLTFDNVKHCLCNDDNAVITSTENQLTHTWTTTITMGAGVSYEISIVNQNMVAINFEAQ